MKRITALALAFIMLFSFAACGKEKAEKYCSDCGKGISESVSFCPSCGAEVKNPAEESEQTTSPVTTTEATTVHEHVYTQTVIPPTCTEKGYTTYTCECGDTYDDDFKDPEHTFENYICIKCDAADKAHAYDFLAGWVKANGEVEDGILGHYYYDSASGMTYGLCYNESNDRLFVLITMYDTHFEMDLKPVNGKYAYYDRYETTWDYEARGKIDGKTYVKEGAVYFDEYTGPDDKMSSFKKHATLMVSSAIIYLSIVLDGEVEGGYFDIADMGFTAFSI